MATKKRTARHLKVEREDLRLSRWDSADYLHTEQDIAEYFDAALEEGGDDPVYMLHVLGTIARARGMMKLASESGLTRAGLFRGAFHVRSQGVVPRVNESYESML